MVLSWVERVQLNPQFQTHGDLFSPSKLVQTILCWLSGSSTDRSLLFGYAQMALNANAMLELCPHDCDKGLLPTILLWIETQCGKYCFDNCETMRSLYGSNTERGSENNTCKTQKDSNTRQVVLLKIPNFTNAEPNLN